VASSKNPNVSSNIDGLFLWDLDLKPIGFTVQANDRAHLVFTPNADFNAVLIQVTDDYWNQFDLENEWTGYWIHAGDDVWLRYSLANEWVGFTT
jgi:hypothetical protein